MEKKTLRELFLSPWLLIAAQILLSGAIAAGAVFYTYDSVIVYRLWKNVLIDLTFLLCFGALFALTYFQKEPQAKPWHLLLPFVVGAGLFAALFFGVQAILDLYVNRTISCLVGISVALAFDFACVIAQDVFAVRRDRRFFRLVTVGVALAVYVGALFLSLFILPHGWVFKSFSKVTHEFPTASAETYALTAEDKAAGLSWFETYLETSGVSGATPAFDFTLGGKRFIKTLSEWESVAEKSTDEQGNVTLVRTFTHTQTGVEARLDAAYYLSTATVEWKVTITNRGAENSPVLSDLYALSASIPVSDPTLYFSGGSAEANDDFALYSRRLGSKGYTFDTVNGRTSMLYLPFFNLVGKKGGATLGIGWSGQWTAHFAAKKGTCVQVKQTSLCGYLKAEESVRSPLVSLCLYSGSNPLKGFNNFRADILRGLGEDRSANLLMFAGAEGQDDTSRANAAGTTAYLAALEKAGVLDALDYAWYDAAWYDTSGSGHWRTSVGDWVVDPVKYPNGFKAVSAELEQKGVKSLLWYEPERVPTASTLFKNVSSTAGREQWLILPTNGSNDCLWNMGDPEALSFMIDYISSSLVENGVSYYRQDFNIDPKRYWESADKLYYDGRTGFAENKYVTGEYAFLDALVERIPGLLIDNCASGGRRIDLEMCRRSVPLWRSDYQCFKEKKDLAEAAQYQTYGLSLWLPYSSVTDPNASDEYALRSLLGACVMCYGDVIYNAKDAYVRFVGDYQKVKSYYSQNYYPLTSCTPRSDFVAMQFGNEKAGVIVAYSRADGKGDHRLSLNGLSAGVTYRLQTVEGKALKTAQGSDLMKKGVTLKSKNRTAYIVLYNEE